MLYFLFLANVSNRNIIVYNKYSFNNGTLATGFMCIKNGVCCGCALCSIYSQDSTASLAKFGALPYTFLPALSFHLHVWFRYMIFPSKLSLLEENKHSRVFICH